MIKNSKYFDPDNENKPFGGKIVIGDDFKQILHVPKGTRAKIVFAIVNSSKLWYDCHVLILSKNMRLYLGNSEFTSSRHFQIEC